MTAPAYATRADLEAQYTPDQVMRAFRDDGATFNQAAFDAAVARASRVADSILAKAWPDAAERLKLASDDGVKACVCTLIMHFGTSRRPEYIGQDGKPIMAAQAAEARKDLEEMAEGDLRPDEASGAAPNRNVVGRLNDPTGQGLPQRMFTPTVGRPEPRGY